MCKVCGAYILDSLTKHTEGYVRHELPERFTTESDGYHYHPFEWQVFFGTDDKEKIRDIIKKACVEGKV